MTRAIRKPIVFLVALVAVVALATLALPALAAPDCPSSGCQTAQVGPFMAGISELCGEKGTCSLTDIGTVFHNVGNWILGVVGALVLLAYVVGGFYFLISGMPGMEKYREKGKTALKQSTVGLVIVFVAFAALTTLYNVLIGTGLSSDAQYVVCGPGDTNMGGSCALNSQCTDAGICVSLCEMQPAFFSASYTEWSQCKDIDLADSNYGFNPGDVSVVSGPTPNQCPGGDNIQCVRFRYTIVD